MNITRTHTHKNTAERWDNIAYCSYLLAGTLLPLMRPSKRDKVLAWRVMDAVAMSFLLVKGIKQVIPAKRPDSLQTNSFPSSHTMNSFTVATMVSAVHKKQAPLWFTAAALIGVSRLLLRRHRTRDVLCGSLLGYAIARGELARRRGWFLPALMLRIHCVLTRTS